MLNLGFFRNYLRVFCHRLSLLQAISHPSVHPSRQCRNPASNFKLHQRLFSKVWVCLDAGDLSTAFLLSSNRHSSLDLRHNNFKSYYRYCVRGRFLDTLYTQLQ